MPMFRSSLRVQDFCIAIVRFTSFLRIHNMSGQGQLRLDRICRVLPLVRSWILDWTRILKRHWVLN